MQFMSQKKNIEVVAYNPDWPKLFSAEAKFIKEALGDNCIEIHHIGSTSVPGLAAKPIIDILPVVKNISKVDDRQSFMENLGYVACGEYGIPLRRYFQKGKDIRTRNVHVFEQGNLEIDRHIKFRDWLCAHPDDLKAYASLKQDLASRFPNDIFSYCVGKDSFVAELDQKAGWNGLRIVNAVTPNEWNAAKHFRTQYFFSPLGIDDPYTWTFEDPKHAHLILYLGSSIIGYAHIQFWSDNRAAIRIIVIDEEKRNHDYGSQFLNMCAQWLKTLGVKSIHAESRQTSLSFYHKNGYVEMSFNDPDGHESNPEDIAVGKIL